MKKINYIISRKRAINTQYRELLKNSRVSFLESPQNIDETFWFTNVLCDDAEEMANKLAIENIQSRRLFYPIHLQPCYKNKQLIQLDGEYNNADKLFKRLLSLPSSVSLTADEIESVASVIKK